MPTALRTLTMAAAEQLCAGLFEPASQERYGLELEWAVHPRADPGGRRPTPAEMAAITRCSLPAGGRVTFEPGGQVELSSAPHPELAELFTAVDTDQQALHACVRLLGLDVGHDAVDSLRPPQRVLLAPRYVAMQQFFTVQGGPGPWMMCNTASTQINISHAADDPATRWHTLHLVAPLLIAVFANSPGIAPNGRRWASLRQGIWWGIDPARTKPVRTDLPPAKAWLEYALDADVMFVRQGSSGTDGTSLPPGLSFGSWMADGHELGWPTEDDLRYHLSTLFPPIRPRGWLELRMLDALPERVREVATLVVAAALSAGASRELRRQLPDTHRWWHLAAEVGLAHPAIANAVDQLFAVAADNLGAVTGSREHHELVESYRRDHVATRRPPCAPRPHDLTRFAPALLS